jgi:hypothetical protein
MNRKKKSERRKQMKGNRLVVVVMGVSILWLSACSGLATSSRQKISEGDQALIEARESNATVNAPVELKTAD